MSNEFPTFSVDPDGNIVSDMDASDPGSQMEESSSGSEEGLYSTDGDTMESGSVSSGDAFSAVTEIYDFQPLLDMQSDIAFLAAEQASSSGYLSSTALDTFDRVVSGCQYKYYCAFRNSSDSYNALLYLSDKITVNGSVIQMQDARSVELSRYRASSGYDYQYYYTQKDVGDIEIQTGSNLMYYTNCMTGYPLLADKAAPGTFKEWTIQVGAVFFVLIVGCLILRRILER